MTNNNRKNWAHCYFAACSKCNLRRPKYQPAGKGFNATITPVNPVCNRLRCAIFAVEIGKQIRFYGL